MIRVALLNKKIGMNTTINFDLETFPVDAVDVVHATLGDFEQIEIPCTTVQPNQHFQRKTFFDILFFDFIW